MLHGCFLGFFFFNKFNAWSLKSSAFHLQNDANLISRLLDIQPVFIVNVIDLYPVSTRLSTDRYISNL